MAYEFYYEIDTGLGVITGYRWIEGQSEDSARKSLEDWLEDEYEGVSLLMVSMDCTKEIHLEL